MGSLTNNHDTIAQRISGLDVGSVVVTLGERGSVACVNGEFFVQSAYSVDAIDTTAAGDTFCGVLAASLSRNLSMQDALMYASAASALACTQLGAQQSVPQQENVHNFLRRQPASSDALNCSLRQFCGLPD
ncbi:MAG: PfkB family carbohydrate kinase [Usitatibacteraceae bacterium]